ncbi:Gfo/Idh/MocA family oxidoreductase [Streptomyces sp. RS10V-4]|uniref:Gfo/Idh/MocA family oxidoreductase n=1 Tax=Streptomyces rhizoryzae TaxID=2932493 RepID=UPI00200559DE|nr:Gfo/Idh/MocA family oxidoreductase [Streptomyces rhizoryzae]MCK7627952.1 Gfo/Idh/MocA family oxidoreductase [Streptomyces rhizoryzae]
MTAPEAPTAPFRVGLIGYGLAGSVFHAPLIAATDGLRLDTVSTRSPERQQQARAEHPQVRTVATADEVLDRAAAGDLDLIVLASPNKTHVPLATAALEAGAAVVVDKPLAATAAEAERLAALADRRGLLLSVFQNRRWDNDFRTLRALLADGALGDVLRFESRFERWRPRPKGGWRESGDPAELGGLLYDLGSHLVDQALTLFGPAVSVYAEADVRRPGAEADDDTFLAVTHAGGVRSHLWVSATTAQLGPRFRVLGSRAGYVKYGLDPQEAALRAGLRPGVRGAADAGDAGDAGDAWGVEPESCWGRLGAGESPQTGGGEPVPTLPGDYPAYYAAIARALRDGSAPPVTATEAAAALRVLEAARASVSDGRAVSLG